ncbi:MAG TPA: IPTL-CTERM sorting domain-containing protein [Thermoanaerobaculia bacterium]|jgi:hypothetical protein
MPSSATQGSSSWPANVTVTDSSQNGSDPDPNHDGNAGDNNDPTLFMLTLAIGEIPTLGTWGLLALALLLGGVVAAGGGVGGRMFPGVQHAAPPVRPHADLVLHVDNV